MNSTTITAILNLVNALLPTIEAAGAALIQDAQQLIADVRASSNATPEQLQTAQQLGAQADAKQDAVYAALKQQQAQDAAAATGQGLAPAEDAGADQQTEASD